MIAANLHNSADVMPHWMLQLLTFIVLRPPGAVSLSIYASGSTDATGTF